MPGNISPAFAPGTHVLVLGTADWNQPIATNQHYMTRELAQAADASVTYVESLALRAPELSASDLQRITARIGRLLARGAPASRRPVPRDAQVVSPAVAPAAWRWTHGFNARSLRRSVSTWLAHPGPRLLWTYSPVTYGLHRVADATVYHCVDLLGKFEGIDEALVNTSEDALAASGARAVASSAVVRSHLEARGFSDVVLWENVADTEVFAAALTAGLPRSRRRAIFAGNLTPKKVDYSLLVALARDGWDVVVAGPRAAGGGDDAEEFAALQAGGVRYLGMLGPTELALEMAQSSLGLIPYVLNPYTQGVSPLKTFEYLAAGLPVLSTPLPGVTPLDGMVAVASSTSEFLSAAASLTLRHSAAAIDQRTRVASAHSWSKRGGDARRLVAALTRTDESVDGSGPAAP